jgi:hypothetical protein
METMYNVWFWDPCAVIWNMLVNPDFNNQMDYVAYQEFNEDNCQYQDFMSAEWSWKQSVCIPFWYRLDS